MAYQPLLVIQCQIYFIRKNSSISNNSFSIIIVFFIYTQLNVKTFLFETIQFSLSTQFTCQKQFHFEQFNLV